MLAASHPELSEDDDWYSIMENLEHIRDLLDDMSRYNNAERLSPVQTDIATLLRSIVCSFRPALDYLGISLKTDIPKSLPLLSLDQTKIRQALLNLLRNARKPYSLLKESFLFPPAKSRKEYVPPSAITDAESLMNS